MKNESGKIGAGMRWRGAVKRRLSKVSEKSVQQHRSPKRIQNKKWKKNDKKMWTLENKNDTANNYGIYKCTEKRIFHVGLHKREASLQIRVPLQITFLLLHYVHILLSASFFQSIFLLQTFLLHKMAKVSSDDAKCNGNELLSIFITIIYS